MEVRISNKRATVIGATGLVGRELVALLDAHPAYVAVDVLARSPRPAGLSDGVNWSPMPRLDRFAGAWPSHAAEAGMTDAIARVLPKGDDFFSCLGTTRRRAGSTAAFRFVDLGINTAFAKTAAQEGYDQYSLVSALGADPGSWVPYARTKGELELAVAVLPFWAVHIYQPGLLVGDREESRLGESVAEALLGGLSTIGIARSADFQAIGARVVATAMVDGAQQTEPSVRRYRRADMLRAAGELTNRE